MLLNFRKRYINIPWATSGRISFHCGVIRTRIGGTSRPVGSRSRHFSCNIEWPGYQAPQCKSTPVLLLFAPHIDLDKKKLKSIKKILLWTKLIYIPIGNHIFIRGNIQYILDIGSMWTRRKRKAIAKHSISQSLTSFH